MTHDSTDPHADIATGGPSAQGIFIGWLAIGLLAVMALFMIVVIGSGASAGFQ